MAWMYELSPAPMVKRPPFDYIASRARYTDQGLVASVLVLNGKPKWGDDILLSTEAGRVSSAMRISPITGQDTAGVADTLLELHAQTEGALRRATVVPDWQEPAAFWEYAPPVFPLSAIPVPALQRFIQEVSRAYETPLDFAAMGVLAAISGAIGNRRRLHVVGEIYAGACLWIVVIGKPGSGKSDPLEKALQPLRDLQDKHIKTYLSAKEEYEAELAAWDGLKKDDRGEKPIAPSPVRILVADTTMESMALDLSQNPHGMVLYRDELATWLAGFDKYRAAGSGSDRANWLEMWSNKTIDVSRKTGMRVIYVPRPFVSVIGTIQPERLQELLGNMDDGFSDRLLCVYPPANVAPLPTHSISHVTMDDYRDLISELLALEPQDDGKPRTVELSQRGLTHFRSRAASLDDVLRDDDLAPALAGTFAKLRIYASRLTHVLHMAMVAAKMADPFDAGTTPVDGAWDLIGYYQEHARMVHAAKGSDPEALRAQHILDLIGRKGWASFSRRDVYRSIPTRFSRPEATEPALKLLCDHGFVREKPMPEHTGRGRPPTQVYDVNPLWNTSMGSQYSHISKITAPIPVPDADPGLGEGYDDERF